MRTRIAVLALVAFVAAACSETGKSVTSPTNLAPVISLFAADASKIVAGATTVLRWDVTGASVSCRIDPAVGNVPVTGSVEVRPIGTTTYTLVCANAVGTVNRTVTVTVG